MNGILGLVVSAAIIAAGVVTANPGLIVFGSSLAISSGLSLLAGDSKSKSKGNKRSTTLDSRAVERILYGRVRVGGQCVFRTSHGDDKKILSAVMVLAAHECDALEGIYVNGTYTELEPNGSFSPRWPSTDLIPVEGSTYRGEKGLIGVAFYDGTQVAADPYLVSKSAGQWTSACVMPGYCYVRISLRFASPQFDSGLPDLSFVVRGKKVFDPRIDDTVWTRNPALCAADWLQSEWALGLPYERIDEESLIESADVCDEAVPAKGGGDRPRYECAAILDASQAWRDSMATLEDAMAGRVVRSTTIMKIFAGAPIDEDEDVPEFGDDAIIGPVEFQQDRPLAELVNTVKAEIQTRDRHWLDDETAEVTDAAYVAADGGRALVASLDLAAVDRRDQAQRLCKIKLESSRLQRRMSTTLSYAAGCALEEWDVVRVTASRYGMENVLMTVEEAAYVPIAEGSSELGVQVTLQEYSNAIYEWAASEEADPPDDASSTVEDPRSAVPDISDLSMAVVRVIDATLSGVLVGRLTWAAPDAEDMPDRIEVRYRHTQRGAVDELGNLVVNADNQGASDISEWTSLTAGATAALVEIGPLKAAFWYEVEARFTDAGYTSDWASLAQWVMPPAVSGDPPWNVRAENDKANSVVVRWRRSTDKSVKRYEIRVSRTGGADVDRAAAPILADGATGEKERIENLQKGPVWIWIQGRRDDGTLTPFGLPGGVLVSITKGTGVLADKDSVGTIDIDPDAVSQTYTSATATRSFTNIDGIATDAIIMQLPAGVVDYPVEINWSFERDDDAASFNMTGTLQVAGTVVKTFTNKKNSEMSGSMVVRVIPGTQNVSLFMKASGGTRVLNNISLTAKVYLR